MTASNNISIADGTEATGQNTLRSCLHRRRLSGSQLKRHLETRPSPSLHLRPYDQCSPRLAHLRDSPDFSRFGRRGAQRIPAVHVRWSDEEDA